MGLIAPQTPQKLKCLIKDIKQVFLIKASSIVAKTLFSATLVWLSFLPTGKAARAIVTADDPNNHLVSPNDFTGVVSFQVFGEHWCTGSLLYGGAHILTAAHCITNVRHYSMLIWMIWQLLFLCPKVNFIEI